MTDMSKYFPWLITLAPLAIFWQQSKTIVVKLFRIFLKVREVPSDYYRKMYKHIYDNSYRLSLDDYDIKIDNFYSSKYKRWIYLPFKAFSLELFLYKKFVPILVTGTKHSINLQYIKFTFNYEKLMNQFAEELIEKSSTEKPYCFSIYNYSGASLKSKSSANNNSSGSSGGNNVTFSGGGFISDKEKYYCVHPSLAVDFKIQKQLICQDVNTLSAKTPRNKKNKYIFTETANYILGQVDKWLQAENWYKERNINWRRGFLLNGKPGNGKSTMVVEIAKKLDLPIYVIQLSTMDNLELANTLNNLGNSPGIILMEDIDSIFNLRESLIKSDFGGLTFDSFINHLGGADSIKNKLIFITTNHLDKVDPAIKRPGRCDEIIDVKPLSHDEKRKMAAILFDDNQSLIEESLIDGAEMSTAEFENLLVQKSLNMLWTSVPES
jgi:hypothetical protein